MNPGQKASAMKMDEASVEAVAFDLLESMGYSTLHGPDIAPDQSASERQTYQDVVLVDRLRDKLARINPDLPEAAIEEAIRILCRVESPSLIENNRRFHRFLTDGVDVSYRKDDREAHAKVWLLDLDDLANNDFLAVNQFTVVENRKNRRPDIVVFVNGLPAEFKRHNFKRSILSRSDRLYIGCWTGRLQSTSNRYPP